MLGIVLCIVLELIVKYLLIRTYFKVFWTSIYIVYKYLLDVVRVREFKDFSGPLIFTYFLLSEAYEFKDFPGPGAHVLVFKDITGPSGQ